MKILILSVVFMFGLIVGSAQSAQAEHDKPCVTATPTYLPTKTPSRTPTALTGQVCAQVIGGSCGPISTPKHR